RETVISPAERDRYDTLVQAKRELPDDIGTKRDSEIRSGWDGSQLVTHRVGSPQSAYRDLEVGLGDFNFDPRVIGVSDTLSCRSNIRVALRIDVIQRVGVAEPDKVNNVDVWRCPLVDQNGNSFEFYIEDTPLFRIHRVKYTTKDGRRIATTDSTYTPGDTTSVLPQQVITRWVDDRGKTRRLTSLRVTSFTRESVRSDVGTLSSLDLPKGVAVVDNRVQQRLGYWDGKKLSAEFVSANEDTAPPPTTPSPSGGPTGPFLVIGILALALIAVAVAAVLLRARIARQTPPPPPSPPVAG
ncbi:MAG: hypothetical protein MUF18_08585, partial [Fimbriiglobus sp.]|nr:hypothetical protein [Fimbriiglobus sp.]